MPASRPWATSLRWRYLGPRALESTNTVRSQESSVLNLALRYSLQRDLTLGLDVFNLTNQSSNDIEYFYASCSAREVQTGACGSGINDRHIHPLEPRTVRVSARMSF